MEPNAAAKKTVLKGVIDAIVGLRSIRTFKPKKIPQDILDSILEAGRHAPSARNIQPWHFIIITNEGIKKSLAKDFAQYIEQSDVTIVGCGNPRESAKWYELETSIAMQNMVLTAWIQGIGSCWIDFEHEEEKLKKILDIPKHLKVVSFVAFGYPDSIPEPTWKKPVSDIVSYNKYSKK